VFQKFGCVAPIYIDWRVFFLFVSIPRRRGHERSLRIEMSFVRTEYKLPILRPRTWPRQCAKPASA